MKLLQKKGEGREEGAYNFFRSYSDLGSPGEFVMVDDDT